jgi:hypothetical protein
LNGDFYFTFFLYDTFIVFVFVQIVIFRSNLNYLLLICTYIHIELLMSPPKKGNYQQQKQKHLYTVDQNVPKQDTSIL